jgi:hypothetical protein
LDDTSLDGVALDQHLVAAARLVPARIEQAEVPEQKLRHRRSPNMARGNPTLAPRFWTLQFAQRGGCGASLSSAPRDRARAGWRSAWRQRHGLRLIELDALFWGRDWQPAPLELFRHRVERETATATGSWSAITARCAISLARRRHADLARPAVRAGDVAAAAAHDRRALTPRESVGHRQPRELPHASSAASRSCCGAQTIANPRALRPNMPLAKESASCVAEQPRVERFCTQA